MTLTVGQDSFMQLMTSSLVTDLKRVQIPEDEIKEAGEFLKITIVELSGRQKDKMDQNQCLVVAATVRDLAIKRMFKEGCPKNVKIDLYQQKDTSWLESIGKGLIGGGSAVGGGMFVIAFPHASAALGISFVGYKAIRWLWG